MQLKVRYHCAKLSELVHEKKSYHLHVNSVDKIMTKNSSQFAKRQMQLSQLKNRKIQSYNYTQYKRSQDIGHANALLYTKICFPSKSGKKQSGLIQNDSFQNLEEQINQRNIEENEAKNDSLDRQFILRSHRQSPIHKSTLLQRTRENIRLAKKIVNPVITYKTSDFQKLHHEAKLVKQRIMKYDREMAKTKAEIYVEKRLQLTSFNRKSSFSSIKDQSEIIKNSSFERQNPQFFTPRALPKSKFSSFVLPKAAKNQ